MWNVYRVSDLNNFNYSKPNTFPRYGRILSRYLVDSFTEAVTLKATFTLKPDIQGFEGEDPPVLIRIEDVQLEKPRLVYEGILPLHHSFFFSFSFMWWTTQCYLCIRRFASSVRIGKYKSGWSSSLARSFGSRSANRSTESSRLSSGAILLCCPWNLFPWRGYALDDRSLVRIPKIDKNQQGGGFPLRHSFYDRHHQMPISCGIHQEPLELVITFFFCFRWQCIIDNTLNLAAFTMNETVWLNYTK